MKNLYSRIHATAAFCLLLAPAFTQSLVDIGLDRTDDGQLEVNVRPTEDFDGVLSALVFTLRWDRNSDIDLGNALQTEAASYINLYKSGGKHEDGMFNYQVYSGFGFSQMASNGGHWEAGKEYTVLRIPVSGRGGVELVNDAWTNVLENNANYYISLGGVDRTGAIYKSLVTTTDLSGTVTIQPNPNEGRFIFSFMNEEAADIRIELMNTLGQAVYTEQLKGFEGIYRKEMDITSMSDGIYYMKITRGENTSVHKIAYH